MSYSIVVASLIFLIIIHEAGHFLMAKKCHIRATKFYLFFPPSVFKFHYRGTEYGIGAIPLGGYVKLPGMYHPDNPTGMWKAQTDALSSMIDHEISTKANRGKYPIFPNTSAVITTSEVSRGNVRDKAFLNAVDVSLQEINAWHHQVISSDLEYDKDVFDKLYTDFTDTWGTDLYWRASVRARLATIFAGPGVNLIAAFLFLTVALWLFTPIFSGQWEIAKVVKDSPAQVAGLKKHDQIISYAGVKTKDSRWVAKAGVQDKTEVLHLVVKRDNKQIPFDIKRDSDDLVGIQIAANDLKQSGWDRSLSLPSSMGQSGKLLGNVAWLNLKGLATIFMPENRKQVGTVVSIVQQSDQIAHQGQILTYIAMISLILAVFNLLPLLPLDGGHIVICLLEKLRGGKPVPLQAVNIFALVGLFLLLSLFFLGLSNDIMR